MGQSSVRLSEPPLRVQAKPIKMAPDKRKIKVAGSDVSRLGIKKTRSNNLSPRR